MLKTIYNYHTYETLMDAIEANDLEAVKNFIEKTTDLKEILYANDDCHQIPLNQALYYGHFDIAKFLLEQHLKLNDQDQSVAINLSLISPVLNKDNLNKSDKAFLQALSTCFTDIRQINLSIYTLLCVLGNKTNMLISYINDHTNADQNIGDVFGSRNLVKYYRSEYTLALSKILENSEQINNRYQLFRNMLTCSAVLDNVELFKQIYAQLELSQKQESYIHVGIINSIACNDTFDIYDHLIDKKIIDKSLFLSFLLYASMCGNAKFLNRLATNEYFNINSMESELQNETPLHWAISENNFSAIQFFCQHGADQTLRNPDGNTALSSLINCNSIAEIYINPTDYIDTSYEYNDLKILKLMLQYGGNVNEYSWLLRIYDEDVLYFDSWPILYHLIFAYQKEAIEVLLQFNPNLYFEGSCKGYDNDYKFHTAMHVSCYLIDQALKRKQQYCLNESITTLLDKRITTQLNLVKTFIIKDAELLHKGMAANVERIYEIKDHENKTAIDSIEDNDFKDEILGMCRRQNLLYWEQQNQNSYSHRMFSTLRAQTLTDCVIDHDDEITHARKRRQLQ